MHALTRYCRPLLLVHDSFPMHLRPRPHQL